MYITFICSKDIIKISKSFGVDAKIIGRVEQGDKKKLSIISENGTYIY